MKLLNHSHIRRLLNPYLFVVWLSILAFFCCGYILYVNDPPRFPLESRKILSGRIPIPMNPTFNIEDLPEDEIARYRDVAHQLAMLDFSYDEYTDESITDAVTSAHPIDLKNLEHASLFFQITALTQQFVQQSAAHSTMFTSRDYDPKFKELIDRLEKDGYDRVRIEQLFASLGKSAYSSGFMAAKIAELHGVRGIGISQSDEESVVTPEGFEQPLTDMTAGACRVFLKKHAKTLANIHKKHGVPANVIVSILMVETGMGSNLGSSSALRSLGSMAATTSVSMLAKNGNTKQIKRVAPKQLAKTLKVKSEWAYGELKALIDYGEKSSINVAFLPGSMYGAIGLCQFMPSNINPYGIDGDKNGKVDLFSVVDAMYSVGNYLEAFGWRKAKTQQQKHAIIRQYNQDDVYASLVLSVANQLDLAAKGKMAAGKNPLASAYSSSPVLLTPKNTYIDPSLRALNKAIPQGGKVPRLGSYTVQ